ncbi:MAG: recombinase family protein [Pseudomonadota bacterium]
MPPRKIGYARVSTEDQTLDLQIDALRAAGCDAVYADHGLSGALRNRPELACALAALEPGDMLVVWKLDRLGRSVAHLIELLDGLSDRGIHFESLTEKLDTTTAFGEFAFHIIAGLAQMERKMIAERTRAGLAAARRRGVQLGRRPALKPCQVFSVCQQMKSGTASAEVLADRYGVSVMTIYRACRQERHRNGVNDGPWCGGH